MQIDKEKIKKFAEECLSEERDSAHNIDHVMRVYTVANKLMEWENVDKEVVEVAILLHDIWQKKENADPSWKTDHAIEWAKMAEQFLRELNYPEDKITHIKDCIISHRYRTNEVPKTLEAKIVFDADKLESVWAIGIARAFAWIGKHNSPIYKKVESLDEYTKENLWWSAKWIIKDKSKHSVQINRDLKEKYILDYLYTDKAKEIAKKRKKFYEDFLAQLEKEIDGEE